jgi:diketogulonate reductase-like aldo/keto reductase
LTLSDQEIEAIRRKVTARTVTLPDGTKVPSIGQGTWHMGDNAAARSEEIATLRLGVRLGLKLIDTAEMYGNGKSESLVGAAIRGIRDQVFLVSKVLPSNASRRGTVSSCENSLRRLGTDRLDLYLLHWKGSVPIDETIEAMESLKQSGKILRWGVSNFDTPDMENLLHRPRGEHCAVNQVLYHLGSRGTEVDLQPWQRRQRIPIMAYCPLAQGGSQKRRLLADPTVAGIAKAHRMTAIQLLLAWCIRDGGVIAIPKASRTAHVIENARAAAVTFTPNEQQALDRAFPRPAHRVPLDIA